MNKEQYVSFEVAKLLKKGGFDWEVNGYFCSDVDNPSRIEWSTKDYNSHKFHVSAPTQQMAIRWLREERGIHIYPIPANGYYYWASIYIENGNITLNKVLSRNGRKAYEEAVEAALKYCLTNLI